MTQTHSGRCFCGAVEFEVAGEPVIQGYCHCSDCRAWSGAPVTAYALWPVDSVSVTNGTENVVSFARSEAADRRHCGICGGALMTFNPFISLIDVYPVLLKDYGFSPLMHIRYGERVIDVPDGLPKYKDMPERAGGSGEMIPD